MEKQAVISIESVYDSYSAMLYGIALEISPSLKVAEDILIKTFEKVHQLNIIKHVSSSICVTLIKLILQTAQKELKHDEQKHNFKLKRFENYPLLHQMLCEQINLDGICLKHKLTPLKASQKLREEFISTRDLLHQL